MPLAALLCHFAAQWSYNQGAQVGGVKVWHLGPFHFQPKNADRSFKVANENSKT